MLLDSLWEVKECNFKISPPSFFFFFCFVLLYLHIPPLESIIYGPGWPMGNTVSYYIIWLWIIQAQNIISPFSYSQEDSALLDLRDKRETCPSHKTGLLRDFAGKNTQPTDIWHQHRMKSEFCWTVWSRPSCNSSKFGVSTVIANYSISYRLLSAAHQMTHRISITC